MKNISLTVLLMFCIIHPVVSQKRHPVKKKHVTYIKPTVKKEEPEEEPQPPTWQEVEALEGKKNNSVVAYYGFEKYEGAISDLENKCLDAFYEKDSITKQKMLKDLMVYRICEQTVEEYVRKFVDTCNATKQVPIRPDHFRPVCKTLALSRSTEKNTIFVMDYIFEKKKYLEENAKRGKTKNIVIPYTLNIQLDAYYRDVIYSSLFYSKCIQEVIQ